MPSPTQRLRAQLQDPGSNLNVWGQLLNDTAITLLDEAIAGVEKISLTGNNGSLTLTSANYASDQARNAALVFTGSPAVNVSVTIPAVEKVYVVSNTTGKDVTLSAGGAGVTLAAGDRAVVWCDGTDCGFGSVTAASMQQLINNAVFAPGVLPGQTGNAGRFLKTDGSVASWGDVPNPDVGGGADATITTSTTLTNTASVVQSVDMATAAQSVKLPDATTLTKGGRKYVILGVGNRTFGVRDAAGTLLTVVPAGGAAELHLRDNATAAGSWGVTGRGLEPALTLVDHTAPTTVTAAVEMACKLTDTLSVHFAVNGTASFWAVAADSTPGASAVGTWTMVQDLAVNTLGSPHCFRISDTSCIVFWSRGTGHFAAVLTVDPTTKAITVGTAASTTTAFLAQVTFSGRPVLAQLTPTLYALMFNNGANVTSVRVTGATVSFGASSQSSGAVTAQQGLAMYRISDTQALAIWIDDSGTAGSPYSIRAAVLTVDPASGAISVGTSAGINDVLPPSSAPPTCQLSATKYLIAYSSTASDRAMAAAITVSGSSVSFGSPLAVDIGMTNFINYTDAANNANRFQPNLYAIDASRALFTFSPSAGLSRHVILTESGGALTAGSILYSLWSNTTGGNFPQRPDGFLAFSSDADEMAVFSVTINGTALDVTGTFADGAVSLNSFHNARFALSGGVFGISNSNLTAGSGFVRHTLTHLFRFSPNAAPRYLGALRRNNLFGVGAGVPVEIAANKVALISSRGMTQPAATGDNVRLQIIEFAQ
jgi:hypothetical protein